MERSKLDFYVEDGSYTINESFKPTSIADNPVTQTLFKNKKSSLTIILKEIDVLKKIVARNDSNIVRDILAFVIRQHQIFIKGDEIVSVTPADIVVIGKENTRDIIIYYIATLFRTIYKPSSLMELLQQWFYEFISIAMLFYEDLFFDLKVLMAVLICIHGMQKNTLLHHGIAVKLVLLWMKYFPNPSSLNRLLCIRYIRVFMNLDFQYSLLKAYTTFSSIEGDSEMDKTIVSIENRFEKIAVEEIQYDQTLNSVSSNLKVVVATNLLESRKTTKTPKRRGVR